MNSDLTLVIDFGSGLVKAGFAGSDSPSLVFPTIFRKQRNSKGSEFIIGEAGQPYSDSLYRSPIERSVICDMNGLESIIRYIYSTLGIKGDSNHVLLTKPPGCDSKQLEDLTQYFLETLYSPSISFISSATLSLISTGSVTGLVCECGYGVTNVVPIFESYGLEHARVTTLIGGCDVDSQLRSLLTKIGMSENDNDAVREVKEQLCYVRTSVEQPDPLPTAYEPPNGRQLMIGNERYLGPEVLFDPSLININGTGISNSISTSIDRCDNFLCRELLPNIVISGGSTMFQGMAERIENDIGNIVKKKVKVIATPERKYGAWVGGSIFASTSVFEQFQITKQDWANEGDKIFRYKSFM
ncbi:actin 1 [Histomonas meleagridis]|uniref:actin 1 n=1 Tax=Histomonas meleagridis TaxID=135588 RepID=UPI00355A7942|nr:actin 1 [Histomonas meleagridis]KAH0801715.1 actin 1 [Histomonas meleagridis]